MKHKFQLICYLCSTSFEHYSKERKFCSNICYYKSRLGNKQLDSTKLKRSQTMTGRKYSEERILKSKLAKRKVLSEEIKNQLKLFLDFGMPDCFIFTKIKIDLIVFKRFKEENYPNGIPWQCKFVEADIDLPVYQEIIKLSKLKMRYKRIASNTGIHHKTVRRILNFLNKRDSEIICYSYDSECWKSSRSSLEIKIESFLKEINEDYQEQFSFIEKQNMPYDFRIYNTNLLIEVNGDYFHCNPVVYKKPINDYQKWAQRRDFFKKDLAKKNGFSVLTIWENDIKKDFETVKIKIKRTIEKCKQLQ